MIWLLGTQRDKTALIKKKKTELLRTDIMALCKELVTRFPVQGKEKSFSLRMSATLVYGVCINLRVQCEELRRATQNLLSVKAVSVNQVIDLPDVASSTHITRGLENDLPGVGDFHISQQDLQLSPSLVRANVRDITLNEGTTMRDLDYQGLDLPILTDKELLEQTWNLEDQPEQSVAGNDQGGQVGEDEGEDHGKRRREEEDGAISSGRKKARVENEVEPQEETLHVAVDPPEMPAAPGRHEEVPEVVVTPAVTEPPKRRTSPQQLDLEEAAADPAVFLPDPVQQDAPEVQDHAPQGVAQVGEPEAEFLQPLMPAGPAKAGRGKKKTTPAQVDEVTQMSAKDIKWNMSDGWSRNLRCGGAVQDLVQLPDEGMPRKDWGEELGGRIKEVLRRRVRAPRWDGADAEGDLQAHQAGVEVAVARDKEVQLEGEQEELRQDTVEVSRDLSVPLAAKSREGSLSRNSLQLEAVQAGDATGQDQVGGESLGGQDLLQTGEQPNLDVTPVQQPSPRDGGLALGASPVLPEEVVTGYQEPAGEAVGEAVLPQEQSLSGGALQQPGEEAHVSEFSLLASIQELEETGITSVTFTRLCPRATTRCLKAATTFQGLLKLEKAAKVVSEQEENYSEITITCIV